VGKTRNLVLGEPRKTHLHVVLRNKSVSEHARGNAQQPHTRKRRFRKTSGGGTNINSTTGDRARNKACFVTSSKAEDTEKNKCRGRGTGCYRSQRKKDQFADKVITPQGVISPDQVYCSGGRKEIKTKKG